MVYVYSQTAIALLGLVPPPDANFSDMEWVEGTAGVRPRPSAPAGAAPAPRPPSAIQRDPSGEPIGANLTVQGLPLLKPPYGRITAINLDQGDIVWQIAHGETPDKIRNSPELKGLTIPRTGQSGIIGVLTTKTLVIAGEAEFTTTATGAKGAMLRAYNKATGSEVGAVYMPAPQSGSPMTYTVNGQQYIVVAISGNGFPGELIAYRLPQN